MILSIFFVCTYNIDFYFLSCALLLIKYTKSSHTANVNKTHLKYMPLDTRQGQLFFFEGLYAKMTLPFSS